MGGKASPSENQLDCSTPQPVATSKIGEETGALESAAARASASISATCSSALGLGMSPRLYTGLLR